MFFCFFIILWKICGSLKNSHISISKAIILSKYSKIFFVFSFSFLQVNKNSIYRTIFYLDLGCLWKFHHPAKANEIIPKTFPSTSKNVTSIYIVKAIWTYEYATNLVSYLHIIRKLKPNVHWHGSQMMKKLQSTTHIRKDEIIFMLCTSTRNISITSYTETVVTIILQGHALSRWQHRKLKNGCIG